MAVGTNSWGITAEQLSQDKDHGGWGLFTLEAFLWYHAAFLFVHWVHRTSDYPAPVTERFRFWCDQVGFFPTLTMLPNIQFGMV